MRGSIQALRSSRPSLSRQARINLDRHASTLGAERLAKIFSETDYEHVRSQSLSLINHLSKWQKLPLLFEVLGENDINLRRMAEAFLRNWLCTYNRTHHIRPTDQETSALRVALEKHGANLERRLELEFRALARMT